MGTRSPACAAAVTPLTSSTDPRTDESLVGDVLAGEAGSFEVLVRRHQQPLQAFLVRTLHGADEAADLAQEVFIKVFTNLEQYNPAFRFKTWLYRIAANAAVDRMRRRRSGRRLVDVAIEESEGAPSLPSREPGPDALLTARETRGRLEAALEDLPAAYRRVLLLRYQGDLRYDEIAAITKLPLGTVKNRIFRARERLKEALR